MSRLPASEAAPQLFDDTAATFARTLDDLIALGTFSRGDLIVATAKRLLPNGGELLDYGCGPGRVNRLLAEQGYCVRAVDFSAAMLAEAHKQSLAGLKIEFVQLDARHGEELPSASYDGIVCSNVIEYVPNAQTLLRVFYESPRPGAC